MNKVELNRRMREFQDRCRELGLSMTYQRLSIYKALLQLEGHPTPDDVFQLVRRAYPTISLATVYKTLERLERAGLISKPNHLHESARYEHRIEHHHHLICLECKRLEDLEADDIAAGLPRDAMRFGLPESARREYEISDYTITFKGICRACRKARPAAVPSADQPAAAQV